jgi:hypothetical protein
MDTQTKKCPVCKEDKPRTEFHAHGGGRIATRCKKCDYEKKKRRDKTKVGLIDNIYNSQIRASKKRGHQNPSYSRKELQQWMLKQECFHEIFASWEKSGYHMLEIPSCDRLNDYTPYTLENIRVVSWKVNKRKYNEDRLSGVNTKQSIHVAQYSIDGKLIQTHHSMRHAHRVTGVSAISISECTRGKARTAGGFIWKKISDPNEEPMK